MDKALIRATHWWFMIFFPLNSSDDGAGQHPGGTFASAVLCLHLLPRCGKCSFYGFVFIAVTWTQTNKYMEHIWFTETLKTKTKQSWLINDSFTDQI